MSLGPIVVQKYGGSSVATAEKILAIAERVKTYLETHPHLVVAVSAMGKTTDQLVALAQAGVAEIRTGAITTCCSRRASRWRWRRWRSRCRTKACRPSR